MKYKIIIPFFLLLSSGAVATEPVASESKVPDREQQQLELCFIYSNRLGYNISYINNPRMFNSISNWMGVPYKYSGKNKNGIDCSGLISQIFLECFNRTVEGSASDIYNNVEPVKKSELKEGDLVFFKIKNNRISHIGVYMGQNKFVHSSLQNGVIISDLGDAYYSKFYYKSGRIKY